jgi:hypothetical protein
MAHTPSQSVSFRILLGSFAMGFQNYRALDSGEHRMVARDGRSPAHDQFIAEKGAFLLRQMEAGIAELVGFAIRGQSVTRSSRQPTVISPVRPQPRPSAWQTFLATTFKLLIWLLGIPASFLTTILFTGWDNWAFLGPISLIVLWLLVRFSWWGLLFPLTAIGGALLFFYASL